jgi:hypothetical protein
MAGHLGRLELSHCTLVPGTTALLCKDNQDLRLSLSKSIGGDLKLAQGAKSVSISDSIVAGIVAAKSLDLESSTIFDETNVEQLNASNSIFAKKVVVERRQSGCVRFSFVPLTSKVPRRFHCQPADPLLADRVAPQFASSSFGDPDYAQLAGSCAKEIRQRRGR